MKTLLTKEIEMKFVEFLYEEKNELSVQECAINGGKHGIVDILSYHGKLERKGRGIPVERSVTWRCYEIKVSKADFYSKHKLTFVGHYNYFVLPQELFDVVKDDIPKGIGCYVYDGKTFRASKKASRKTMRISQTQMQHGFLVSSARDARRWMRNKDKITKKMF